VVPPRSQGGDAPMLTYLMGQLRIERVGPGRARTRLELLRAGKAYSSRAIRQHLRGRGIIAVIPQPSDQIGHRNAAAPPLAGHPRSTPTTTGAATSSNAASATRNNGAASPPATTNSPSPTAAVPSSWPSQSGSKH